jgi:hypothetical protein
MAAPAAIHASLPRAVTAIAMVEGFEVSIASMPATVVAHETCVDGRLRRHDGYARSGTEGVLRALAAPVAAAALDAQVTGDLPAADIANGAPADEPDRPRDETSHDGAHGRAGRAPSCLRIRGQRNDRGHYEDSSTKRSHRDHPSVVGDSAS